MKLCIEELKGEIKDLKARMTDLEKYIDKTVNNDYNLSSSKSSNMDSYYTESKPSEIYVKNLKKPTRDRFGKIGSMHIDIQQDFENRTIDKFEHKTMIHLAVANKDLVSAEYLMEMQRLTLEQIMEILKRLEEMNYIEVIEIKKLIVSKQQLELLLNSVKESITKAVNAKEYSDSKELKEKFENDLEEYNKLEDIITELI